MSSDLEVRVTVLEQGFQKLQSTADCALTLARHADRDLGDFKARQDAFQLSLNALQETQGEHTARLNGIDKRLHGIDKRLDGIEEEVRQGISKLAAGQEVITRMLTKAIG
ncbi:hypothetical protein ACFQ1S_13490 [Kibdelosporangium lantanae]|uniref:Uncharacterized protein n=1 Tax=Kibdelosporangium lantanae TaxID=1497396 RepID=A0ABW3M7R8_9PSEU